MLLDDARPLRFSMQRNFAAPCVAEYPILPNSHCPDPGHYVLYALNFLQMAAGDLNMKAEVVLTETWSTAPNASLNTSVMGMVESGDVDVSPTIMNLNQERARVLNHTPALHWELSQLELRYRRWPGKEATLGTSELLIRPIGLWAVTFTAAAPLLFAAAVSRVNGSGCLQLLRDRLGLLFWIIFTVAMSALSSFLCLLFADIVPPGLPITSLRNMAKRLASGEFRLVSNAQILDMAETRAILDAETADTRPRLVFLAAAADTLGQFGPPCQTYRVGIKSTLWFVVYYRADNPRVAFLQDFAPSVTDVLSVVTERINANIERKEAGMCFHKEPFLLSFDRFWGFFVIFSIFSSVSCGVVLLERMFSRKRWTSFKVSLGKDESF